ncbi:MAG: endo-1,4-beta-xylanase [Pirellulaceae bacterium]
MHVLRTIATALLVMLGCPALPGPEGTNAAWSAEEDLFQGAAQRIEAHRKSDAALVVVDTAGQPLPDVRVKVEQTRHQFLFGCNFFQFGKARNAQDEDAYRTQFADLFNYATLAFYWPSYEPRQGQPQHAYTQEVAQWCHDHGITTKGHPLAWNYFEPRWLPDDLREVRRLQMERITDCVTRFRGLIDIWDVVNEATHYEREEFQQRAPKITKMWTAAGRVPFVNECFQRARSANEFATLLINDYRVDPAYGQLITDLTQQAGQRPFDVIGLQSHMHGGVWSNEKIWETCERFAPFEVPLHFTELTVLSGAAGWERTKEGQPWPSTPAGEAQQAEDVVRIYTMLFSHPAVAAVTWWDFADRNAWQGAPAGFLGTDLTPKPAYTALKDLIKNQWWTRAELTTDPQGGVAFRGFLGDYKITVRLPSGKDIEAAFVLKKKEGQDVTRIVVDLGT